MAKRNILTVEVMPGTAAWSCGDTDTTLTTGVHDVDVSGNRQLAKSIRDAAAAGIGVRILDPKEGR